MNTPRSREGNLVRYLVYFVVFVFTALADNLAIKSPSISIWNVILFLVLAAMCLLFYIYRYNREQRFFDSRFNVPWLSSFNFTLLLSFVVAAGRIGISYLQLYKGMPASGLQQAYASHSTSSLYWFMMLANGLVLPILGEYLCTGFLFNYWFRTEKKGVAYARHNLLGHLLRHFDLPVRSGNLCLQLCLWHAFRLELPQHPDHLAAPLPGGLERGLDGRDHRRLI